MVGLFLLLLAGGSPSLWCWAWFSLSVLVDNAIFVVSLSSCAALLGCAGVEMAAMRRYAFGTVASVFSYLLASFLVRLSLRLARGPSGWVWSADGSPLSLKMLMPGTSLNSLPGAIAVVAIVVVTLVSASVRHRVAIG